MKPFSNTALGGFDVLFVDRRDDLERAVAVDDRRATAAR